MTQQLPTAEQLVAMARQQWAETEAAIDRIFAAPAAATATGTDWAAVDVLRHLANTARRTPGIIDALLRDGTIANFPDDDANAEGLAARQDWIAADVRRDFNEANEAIAARIEQLTPADLESRVNLLGREWAVADLLGPLLVGHQKAHLAQALAGAGLSA